MKFSIERTELLEALQKVQSVVEKKNTVQILGNILCSVEDSHLSLFGTDLEVGIKVKIPSTVHQPGKATLSAKHFFEIVKELPNRELTLNQKDNNWIEITSGKIRFNVVSLPADEFPSMPSFEEKDYLDARVNALSNMIDRTGFAVSTDATRYHLNGVFFEPTEDHIMRMTATDGHRLSFVEQEVFKEDPKLKRGVIIPKKGLGELRKLLDQSNDTIGLCFERGYVFAHSENTYLFVRLIEGEYPDVRQVIPKGLESKIDIPRDLFMAALKRVSLLAHEKSKGVKVQLDKNQLVITSNNPDMGDAREELEIEYTGKPVEIGFNAKYLLECMPVIEAETIQFSFKDKLNPGVVQGKDQQNHTYVIMPMRI